MKTPARAFVIAALMVVVVGCSKNSTPSSTSTTTSSVGARLLTESDVGARWKKGAAPTASTFADATQVPCEGMSLDAALASRLRPTSGVQFEPVEKSYLFLSELVTFGDASQLATDMNSYLDAERRCAAKPNNGQLTFKEVSFPALGDQSSAWVLSAHDSGSGISDTTEFTDTTTASVPGVTTAVWYIRSALVRIGGTLINVNLTEVLEVPNQMLAVTDAEFQRIVSAAVSKFSAK